MDSYDKARLFSELFEDGPHVRNMRTRPLFHGNYNAPKTGRHQHNEPNKQTKPKDQNL